MRKSPLSKSKNLVSGLSPSASENIFAIVNILTKIGLKIDTFLTLMGTGPIWQMLLLGDGLLPTLQIHVESLIESHARFRWL